MLACHSASRRARPRPWLERKRSRAVTLRGAAGARPQAHSGHTHSPCHGGTYQPVQLGVSVYDTRALLSDFTGSQVCMAAYTLAAAAGRAACPVYAAADSTAALPAHPASFVVQRAEQAQTTGTRTPGTFANSLIPHRPLGLAPLAPRPGAAPGTPGGSPPGSGRTPAWCAPPRRAPRTRCRGSPPPPLRCTRGGVEGGVGAGGVRELKK